MAEREKQFSDYIFSPTVLLYFLRAWAESVHTLMRTKTGRHHAKLTPLFVILWVVLYVTHTRDQRIMLVLYAYLIVHAIERLGHLVRPLRGIVENTEYSGKPWLAGLLVKNESLAKVIVEPAITFCGGFYSWHQDQTNSFAGYFVGAGVAMFVYQMMIRHEEEKILCQMQNYMMANEDRLEKIRRFRR